MRYVRLINLFNLSNFDGLLYRNTSGISFNNDRVHLLTNFEAIVVHIKYTFLIIILIFSRYSTIPK